MKIKNLFDDLKKIGRKKYYSRNGYEEIYFIKKGLEIEVINVNNAIDLVINHNGLRENYLNSKSLTYSCKKNIELILKSYIAAEIKAKRISQILIETFKD